MAQHPENCKCMYHDSDIREQGYFSKGHTPTNKKSVEALLWPQNTVPGHTDRIKRRLIDEGLLEEICNQCGLGPEWRGEVLSLQLNHVDGDGSNWRLKNLEILCPNCHAQTSTYGGKNVGKNALRVERAANVRS